MSEIFIPGISSRFNSERVVDDLMRLERIPRDRVQNNIERLEGHRVYWQDLNRRANALRESARHLFSFQNPFNDRMVRSSDDSILSGTATRAAIEQDRSFTVRQLAQADRFLSVPLEENFRVESGTYTFTVGSQEISFDFRGGTLREFTEALNRRNRDVLQASLIAVTPGTRSLLIESRVTGEENRLSFAGASLDLGVNTGMIEQTFDEENNSSGFRPLNPVSLAQNSIILMEGIEIQRPGNDINDLIPGLTITARQVSDRPVRLQVETNVDGVKDAIINFVGNFNRVMAEINILTRNDDRILDELTYLTREERDNYRSRLGVFSGDTTLMQLRNSLMQIIGSAHPTSEYQDLALLAHIGISTDARRTGGAHASQLRGYLEIDERMLDDALANRLPAVRELFANDTTGTLIADSGVAVSVDNLLRPFTETGGLFSIRANTVNSQISQEQRRVETMDRQLLAREAELRRQFNQMESAYNRMQQMSTSFDRFNQQNFHSR